MSATLQVDVHNDAVVEYSWVDGALKHAQQHHHQLLDHLKKGGGGSAAPPPLSRSHEEDEDLYRAFRRVFPCMDINVLRPDDPLWPYLDREFWGPLLRRWSHVVPDPTLLTLIRVDASRPPLHDNAVVVPRLKWTMIEIARSREGVNHRLLLLSAAAPMSWGGLLQDDDDGGGLGGEEEEGLGCNQEEEEEEASTHKANTTKKQQQQQLGAAAADHAGGGVRLCETRRFWTIEWSEGGHRQQQPPPPLSSSSSSSSSTALLLDDLVNKLGGGDQVRALVEEEVRRQADSIRLVQDSNQAAVEQQAREAAPASVYKCEAARRAMGRGVTVGTMQKQEGGGFLGKGGLLVVDDTLSEEVVRRAREEARSMMDKGLLCATPQHASGTRLDLIRWLHEDDDLLLGGALRQAVLLLKGIAHEVMMQQQQGEEEELVVPRQCMLACYPGKGACYVPHRDNVPASLASSSCGGNDREVTAILYLNNPTAAGTDDPEQQHQEEAGGRGRKGHKEEEDGNSVGVGGALRCYLGARDDDEEGSTATEVRDVYPKGGRLVVFRSREVLHEVRPAYHKDGGRWALSIWILGKRRRSEGQGEGASSSQQQQGPQQPQQQ